MKKGKSLEYAFLISKKSIFIPSSFLCLHPLPPPLPAAPSSPCRLRFACRSLTATRQMLYWLRWPSGHATRAEEAALAISLALCYFEDHGAQSHLHCSPTPSFAIATDSSARSIDTTPASFPHPHPTQPEPTPSRPAPPPQSTPASLHTPCQPTSPLFGARLICRRQDSSVTAQIGITGEEVSVRPL